jgi:hypothetical protein
MLSICGFIRFTTLCPTINSVQTKSPISSSKSLHHCLFAFGSERMKCPDPFLTSAFLFLAALRLAMEEKEKEFIADQIHENNLLKAV